MSEDNSSSNDADTNIHFELLQLDANSRRRKLSNDERLDRNRERNRVHARRTRERKRTQWMALQHRLNELKAEGKHLRDLIDESFTVSGLLGLAHSTGEHGGNIGVIRKENSDLTDSEETKMINPNAEHSYNRYEEKSETYQSLCTLSSSIIRDDENDNTNGILNYEQIMTMNHVETLISLSKEQATGSGKRIRRSGKLSEQERDKIRKERNRLHAKKTRDRKKMFQEQSEKAIFAMEGEAIMMRKYLHSVNLLSNEELSRYEQRDLACQTTLRQIAQQELKSNNVGCHESNDDDEEATAEPALHHHHHHHHHNHQPQQQQDLWKPVQPQCQQKHPLPHEKKDTEYSRCLQLPNQPGDADNFSEEGDFTSSSGSLSQKTNSNSSSIFFHDHANRRESNSSSGKTDVIIGDNSPFSDEDY